LRLRRLRKTESIRRLLRETTIEPASLVCPIFIRSGSGVSEVVESMPGIYRLSIDKAISFIEELMSHRINNVLLFGIPDIKMNLEAKHIRKMVSYQLLFVR